MSVAARPKGAALALPGRPLRADDAVADGEGAHPYRASRSRLSIRSSVSAGVTGTLPWRSHAIAAANEPRLDSQHHGPSVAGVRLEQKNTMRSNKQTTTTNASVM